MTKQKLNDLRKRAEERLGNEIYSPSVNSNEELRTALYELHTHQIELELQNEELRSVQQELVETRDQYIDLYDFAPIGYVTLNDRNLIVEANLTLADLLGAERKFLPGRQFSEFILPEDQDIFYKHFRKLIDLNRRKMCELRMQKRDGRWFWAKLECVPKAKSDKSGILIRIALHDITESKRLETEIMMAKKLEATALLAGGIAHDFNNLLTVILLNLELAQEDMLHGRPVTNKLQDAQIACRAAGSLTKKFLTFSSGGKPATKCTSVKSFLTDSVSLVLAGSNMNFECSFPEGLWSVDVDAGQMAQAIGNVITNAREAMPQGGVIRISAENARSIPEKNRGLPGGKDAKYVKITIADQGAGIPMDILPQVFDPYFSSKQMGQEKGLGLGLAIAYSIIKKHGGAIDIASQQNIGTTVSIYLPASGREIVPQTPKPQKVVSFNKKILVMDDEEMLRNLFRNFLENLGYEIEVACDGEEAIQIFSRAQRAGLPFGAVILDLTIKGGMGGKETIKRLKELEPDIRAIVASGYSNDPVMSNCREYGFDDALQKPFSARDLEKHFKNIIGTT